MAYASARLFRIQPKPKRPPKADSRSHAAAGRGTVPTPKQPPGVAQVNDEGEKDAAKKGLSEIMEKLSTNALPMGVENDPPGATRPPDASTAQSLVPPREGEKELIKLNDESA